MLMENGDSSKKTPPPFMEAGVKYGGEWGFRIPRAVSNHLQVSTESVSCVLQQLSSNTLLQFLNRFFQSVYDS